MLEKLLSAAEAAEIAGCHRDTIRRAVQFGLLEAQKVGKVVVISQEHLDKWIAAGMPNHRRKSTRKVKIEETPLGDKDSSEEP